MDEKKLIEASLEGVKNGFVGRLKTKNSYGAAVLTKKGNIYSSGAYYSDTYSLTLHAEQAVLAHAAAHGEYEIVGLVVTGIGSTKENPVYPCHMCKQLLWESHLKSKINMEIILVDKDGKVVERLKILDMINFPWPGK